MIKFQIKQTNMPLLKTFEIADEWLELLLLLSSDNSNLLKCNAASFKCIDEILIKLQFYNNSNILNVSEHSPI